MPQIQSTHYSLGKAFDDMAAKLRSCRKCSETDKAWPDEFQRTYEAAKALREVYLFADLDGPEGTLESALVLVQLVQHYNALLHCLSSDAAPHQQVLGSTLKLWFTEFRLLSTMLMKSARFYPRQAFLLVTISTTQTHVDDLMEFVGKALQLKEAKQVFASDPKILIECAQLAVNSVMNILDLEIEVAGSTLYSLELFHLFAIACTAILTMPHVPVTAWFTRKQKVMRLMRKHSKAVFPNRDDWQSDRPFESVQEFLDLYKATDCLSQKLNVIQVLCMCYWAIELIFRQRGGHLSQVDVAYYVHFPSTLTMLLNVYTPLVTFFDPSQNICEGLKNMQLLADCARHADAQHREIVSRELVQSLVLEIPNLAAKLTPQEAGKYIFFLHETLLAICQMWMPKEWDEVYEIEGLLRLEPELMARPNLMLQMLHAIYHGIDEAHFANDLLSFSEHVDAEKAPFHRDLGNNITMLMRLYISLAVQYIKVCDDAGPSFLSAYADLLFTTIARSFSEPVDNLMTGNFGRRPADIVEEATVNRLVVCIDAYSRSNCLPRYKLKQLLGYIFCKCCDILKTLSAKSPRLHDTRPEHQSFGDKCLFLLRTLHYAKRSKGIQVRFKEEDGPSMHSLIFNDLLSMMNMTRQFASAAPEKFLYPPEPSIIENKFDTDCVISSAREAMINTVVTQVSEPSSSRPPQPPTKGKKKKRR